MIYDESAIEQELNSLHKLVISRPSFSNQTKSLRKLLRKEVKPEMKELHSLLKNLHLTAVMQSVEKILEFHNGLRNHNRRQSAASILRAFAEDQNNLSAQTNKKVARLVHVEKLKNQDIGIILGVAEVQYLSNKKRQQPTMQHIMIVERIIIDSPAWHSNLVEVGDRVCMINGVPLLGMNKDEMFSFSVQEFGRTHVNLKIINKYELIFDIKHTPQRCEPYLVKACFDYDPGTYPESPCLNGGLKFNRGDILEVLDLSDKYWWQARIYDRDYIESCGSSCSTSLRNNKSLRPATKDFVGLIPSSVTQEIRIAFSDSDREEIVAYEKVVLFKPEVGLHRPVVLVGSRYIARSELITRLVSAYPRLYTKPWVHTSCSKAACERADIDYHFVEKEWFERELLEGNFVEYEQKNGNYYGVHKSTIYSLMQSGLVVLLEPLPQFIKSIRTCYFKPYIIFLQPEGNFKPKLRCKKHFTPNSDDTVTKVERLEELFEESNKISSHFVHTFDKVVKFNCMQNAYKELVIVILKRIDSLYQYVPESWKNKTKII